VKQKLGHVQNESTDTLVKIARIVLNNIYRATESAHRHVLFELLKLVSLFNSTDTANFDPEFRFTLCEGDEELGPSATRRGPC
jgi:hypothetical protein